MADRLLVYDGTRCPFRAAAAALAGRVDDLHLVRWQEPDVGAFLSAQFGGRPFVFTLVDLDEDAVYAGGRAVERLLADAGAPAPLVTALGGLYPRIAGPLGRLLHGRVPADIDGRFPLDATARAHVAAFARDCRMPACAG